MSSLAALGIEGEAVADLAGFSNRLYREADAWKRRGGLAQERRLSKRDADIIWRRQFAGAGAK